MKILLFIALLLSGCAEVPKYSNYDSLRILNNKSSRNDIDRYLMTYYSDKWTEELIIVLLDDNQKYITHKIIASGSNKKVSMNISDIYINCLINNSSHVIVAHNHIGFTFAYPSEEDLDTIEKFRKFSKTTKIKVDFVITADKDIYTNLIGII